MAALNLMFWKEVIHLVRTQKIFGTYMHMCIEE